MTNTTTRFDETLARLLDSYTIEDSLSVFIFITAYTFTVTATAIAFVI